MNRDDIFEAADELQVVIEAYDIHGLTERGRDDLMLVIEAAHRYADLLD